MARTGWSASTRCSTSTGRSSSWLRFTLFRRGGPASFPSASVSGPALGCGSLASAYIPTCDPSVGLDLRPPLAILFGGQHIM